MKRLVHLDHEFVEMDAALALDRRMLEEQVHQHRLAASDRTMDVQSLRRILASTGEAEPCLPSADAARSEEHTSELQSLMRISYAVFCLKKKKYNNTY